MAKKQEEVETLPAVKPSNVPTTIEREDGAVLSIDDMFEQIESAELGLQLDSDYFKLEAGESARVVFVEMTQIPKLNRPGEMTDAVKLIGKDKRYKINADAVIVSTCKALDIAGRTNVPLDITCIGEKRGKNGFNYKQFVICELQLQGKK